jgi:hypothetical protein
VIPEGQENQRGPEKQPGPEKQRGPEKPPAARADRSDAASAAEARALLAAFGAEDPAGLRALLRANADLQAVCLEDAELKNLLRLALADTSDATLVRALADARRRLAGGSVTESEEERVGGTDPAPGVSWPTGAGASAAAGELPTGQETPGVFTDLTRELPPAQARVLFEKIAPLLAYELLRALDQNANVGTVQRVADHLVDPAVQARLRAADHIRDAILDELIAVLRADGVALPAAITLDRESVFGILQSCGAVTELMTLVNCIRISRSSAG